MESTQLDSTPTEKAIALHSRYLKARQDYLKARQDYLKVEQQLYIALRNPQVNYSEYQRGIREATN